MEPTAQLTAALTAHLGAGVNFDGDDATTAAVSYVAPTRRGTTLVPRSVLASVPEAEPATREAPRRPSADDGRLLVNRYRLLDLLGRGGFGSVWRARDEVLNRDVAVKELFVNELQGGSAREHLLREAQAAARLSTPGAVAVYDVLEDGGRPYIVMELLSGRTLAQTLAARGPLPPSDVIHMGLQLLATLEAAHAAGVLHRDLKPANVMLTDDPRRVVLMDFGIAKLVDQTGGATLGAVGTPDFMAPELARVWKATPASDLYSLGVTLRCALEGGVRSPRDHPTAGGKGLGLEDEHGLDAAGPLAPVLDALLQDDPHARPSAVELRRLLDVALQVREGLPARSSQTLQLLTPTRRADESPGQAIGAAASHGPTADVRPATARPAARRLIAVLAVLAALVAAGAWTADTLGSDPPSGSGTSGNHSGLAAAPNSDRNSAQASFWDDVEQKAALDDPRPLTDIARAPSTPTPSASSPARNPSATPSSLAPVTQAQPATARPARTTTAGTTPTITHSPSTGLVVAELCYIGPDIPALRDALGYSQSWTYEWVRPGTCHFDTVGKTDDDSLYGGLAGYAHFEQPRTEADLARLDTESFNARLWEYLNR